MSRARLSFILLPLAAAASVLASGCGGGSKQSAASPQCLPASIEHSAKLAGLPVYVSPAPGTDTASPRTQVSFLGVPAGKIADVSVMGARSGPHPGRLRAYSQGDGASFVPARAFDAGENVKVGASLDGRRVSFAFRVDTPYPTAKVPPFHNPIAPAGDYESFPTLPGVQAPTLTVTTADRDPAAGDVFMTNGPGPGSYGSMIYTPQGRLVWFRQPPDGETAENLSVQRYEGSPHLTFWQGNVLSLGFGQGEDLVLDSSYKTVARVAGGNGLQADLHDFQLAPHDISYTTAFNPIRCDLHTLGGARDGAIIDTAVQEVDMRTGLVRWEWHSLDHVAASESETAPSKGPSPWDWFHLNSIDPLPDGDLVISARSTWASYRLQDGTGKILWRLGGNKSSFKMGPGTRTAWQHDARLLPGGVLTVFDDGANPPVHHVSRGLRIALDYRHHEARLLSAYTHPYHLLATSQGNMQTLPSGNAVVGYGGIPQVSEYAPGGALLFDAHLPLEMVSYRAFRFPWSGRPTIPPALRASLNNTGEQTIVRMSWNGATGVAFWRVLGGSRPGSLTPRATVATSGFETTAFLSSKQAFVAVQALDAGRRVLGATRPVKVSSYAAAYPIAGERR